MTYCAAKVIIALSGLLLCKTKDRIKAEYALRDIQKPIGISDYELGQALPKDFRGSLPAIEGIEKALEIKQLCKNLMISKRVVHS